MVVSFATIVEVNEYALTDEERCFKKKTVLQVYKRTIENGTSKTVIPLNNLLAKDEKEHLQNKKLNTFRRRSLIPNHMLQHKTMQRKMRLWSTLTRATPCQ